MYTPQLRHAFQAAYVISVDIFFALTALAVGASLISEEGWEAYIVLPLMALILGSIVVHAYLFGIHTDSAPPNSLCQWFSRCLSVLLTIPMMIDFCQSICLNKPDSLCALNFFIYTHHRRLVPIDVLLPGMGYLDFLERLAQGLPLEFCLCVGNFYGLHVSFNKLWIRNWRSTVASLLHQRRSEHESGRITQSPRAALAHPKALDTHCDCLQHAGFE